MWKKMITIRRRMTVPKKVGDETLNWRGMFFVSKLAGSESEYSGEEDDDDEDFDDEESGSGRRDISSLTKVQQSSVIV